MDFLDYYQILGVARSAKIVEIKKAYRQLALKHHPDKNLENPKAHEQFIRIQEAYEVLKDPVKKIKYDQLYDMRVETKRANSYSKSTYNSYKDYYNFKDNSFQDIDDEDSGFFSKFFTQFFSRKKSKYDFSNLYKGKDIKGKLSIDLEEAFLGSERVVNIKNENLRIKIKPGVKNQQIIKIKGKGNYGEIGTERGDLIITISVKPHQIFKRKENDLYRDINVSIYTAILGGKIQFETLHGTIIIGIPESTKTGTQMRVKGKGMPNYNNPGEFGDLFVKIQHKMPTGLTEEEKNLLKKLKELNNLKNENA